jgi:type II secretory pathway pseudopilin PulG
MKIHHLHNSRRQKQNAAGFTLIEISLVIALLLGLIAVVFLGLGNYRKGADQAKCKMQLAAVQKAVRSHANMQNLTAGTSPLVAADDVFGPGLVMEIEPTCPADGTDYTWAGVVPAVGVSYGTCDTTDPSHALTGIEDW